MLLLSLSETDATSQDGSSLEFFAAIAGRQCYILDASGRGLWWGRKDISTKDQLVKVKVKVRGHLYLTCW